MQILPVDSGDFRRYGRILTGVDGGSYEMHLADRPIPENVVYIPADPELEKLSVTQIIRRQVFGGLPLQAGLCAGRNRQLNALEYHACSEVNVAATDLILLLGHRYDMTLDGRYDTAMAQAFFLPKGTAVELYSSTLHFAPCGVGEGGAFQAVILLPAGVNAPLPSRLMEGALCGVSKWVLKHPSYQGQGLADALLGENLSV